MKINSKILVQIGALGLLAGMLLPWGEMPGKWGAIMDNWGYEGDGFITGGLGMVALLVTIFSKDLPGKSYSIGAGILGLLAFLVVYPVFGRIEEIAQQTGLPGSPGAGLFISVAGAFLVILGGFSRVGAPKAAGRLQ